MKERESFKDRLWGENGCLAMQGAWAPKSKGFLFLSPSVTVKHTTTRTTMQSNTADPKPSSPKAERKKSSGLSASSPRFGYQPFAPAVSSFLNKAKDLAHDFTHKEKRRSGDQGRQGEQAPNTVNEPAVQGAANDGFGKNPYESGLAGRQKEVESM